MQQPKRPEDGIPLRFIALASFCTLALTALIFSVYGLNPQDSLNVGEPSPRTFRAPVSTPVEDALLTERQRQTARAQVEPIFTSNPQLERLVINAITSANLPGNVQAELISAYQNPGGVNDAQREALIEEAVSLSPPSRRQDVRLLLESRLISTSTVNEDLTNRTRSAAAEAVVPIMQSLDAGQIIVSEGETLTEDNLRVLTQVGLYNPRAEQSSQLIQTFFSSALLALLLALPLLYLYQRTNLSFAQLSFLVLLSLVVLTAQRLTLEFNPNFIFLSLVPILVAVLVSEGAAVLWAIWLAASFTLLDPSAPLFILAVTLSGGICSALLARTFKARPSLFFAGTVGGVIAALSYLLLLVLHGSNLTVASLSNVLLILGGGLLAGIVALGILPVAESVADFLTDFRLAELSNPSTPLLQRLLLEAPGTYQHSLIISNLVEQAVTNIGGNALLARVGALYHDVGKMKRPHFFVENQLGGENPHNKVSPHLSYLIITSHVRDGVDLLREYKLPKALEPFAATHHGTTVLSYFYKQALENSNSLDELNFRYPGPKPQSKEEAVLMLADAIESTSRTLKEPSQGSIRAMIDRIIEMRLQDGQLAESPLNLHDLEVIANTFERMLTAILHRRIQYPSNEEIKRLERGGDNRRNSAVPAA